MTKETFNTVNHMISKECCRNDLSELCDYWGVTTEDFDEFLGLAEKGFESENSKNA